MKRKIKITFINFYLFISKPFICLYNLIFTSIYPFWQARNVFSDKAYYSFNNYQLIPVGWRKAFGKQLTKDLKKALKQDKGLKTFRFFDIKEKYGQLCLYANGYGQETEKIIRYYENLSICYCLNCGKPVKYVNRTGYINYLCENCFDKEYKEGGKQGLTNDFEDFKKECRLTREDIPRNYKYELNFSAHKYEEVLIDMKIDYYKLWSL